MQLDAAVKSGCRIRHRDWPPYHYAEMRPAPGGVMRLCRISPNGDTQPLELTPEHWGNTRDWKILDLRPE